MTRERVSNFEALRLVAIFMIIVHHLVIKSDDSCGYITPWNANEHGYVGLIINSLVVGGVNIFILISGWFGIRTIWTQIFRLVLDCFIYSIITNIICVVFLGVPFEIRSFIHSTLFFNNWFVEAFIMFLLLIPIINAAISVFDNKTFVIALACLTIFNVGFGFCMGKLNINGYNALNFAYLYIIARWLRRMSATRWFGCFAHKGWLIWLLCAVPIVAGFILIASNASWTPSMSQKLFGYNNPFIVMSSIAFFCWFSTFEFQSSLINRLAKGTFGVFLLHTTSLFIPFRSEFFGNIIHQYGYWSLFFSALGLFIICLLISSIIEILKTFAKPYCYLK
ncbi:MAG: acyltransferase family protein [Prevotella sp.]|nr:acyltransferase family protein [Prevotella sp.]